MAEKESHEPTHKAFSVIKREGKKDYWLNIGVAFPTRTAAASPSSCRPSRSTARSSAARKPRAKNRRKNRRLP